MRTTAVDLHTSRAGTIHVADLVHPDYFLCGTGGKYGAPVTVGLRRESTAEEFRRMGSGCSRCKRALRNPDIAAMLNRSAAESTPEPAAPAYSKPGDTRLTATVTPRGITIYRHRYAGISGPDKEFPLPDADAGTVRFSLEELTAYVETHGFEVAGTWRAELCSGEIWLETDVVPSS